MPILCIYRFPFTGKDNVNAGKLYWNNETEIFMAVLGICFPVYHFSVFYCRDAAQWSLEVLLVAKQRNSAGYRSFLQDKNWLWSPNDETEKKRRNENSRRTHLEKISSWIFSCIARFHSWLSSLSDFWLECDLRKECRTGTDRTLSVQVKLRGAAEDPLSQLYYTELRLWETERRILY